VHKGGCTTPPLGRVPMMPEVMARAAKRVVGDIVACVFEMGDVLVCLGLHKVTLAKSHVALDRSNIALEGIELGFSPREGVAEIVHSDNLGVQARMSCGPCRIAKESVAQCGPEKEVVEPSRESSDALALLGTPGLSIDLEDPWVLTGRLTKVVSEDTAILEFLDPVSNAETAVICMDEEVGVLIVIDAIPRG
jgi:hypothetical protein